MDVAVAVIWWIGLAGALVQAVLVVKLIFLINKVLREITVLGERIREAASGVSEHTAALERL